MSTFARRLLLLGENGQLPAMPVLCRASRRSLLVLHAGTATLAIYARLAMYAVMPRALLLQLSVFMEFQTARPAHYRCSRLFKAGYHCISYG